MKKLIVFNWKMAPQTLREAKSLLTVNSKLLIANKRHEFVIAPPFVYLSELKNLKTKKIKLGAQNVFYENPPAGGGAYTGEISPQMLKNLGVEYVIIGHSERRQHLNETDEMVNKKVLAALKAGLKVILCVGEPASVRHQASGIKKAKEYIKTQLQKDLAGLTKSYKLKANSLFVAYEPLWAISSSQKAKQDTHEDATEMSKFIKNFLKAKSYKLKANVLYGGSVNSKNILNFINQPEIDGALIGRASVDIKKFKKILTNLHKSVTNNTNNSRNL